MNIYNSDETNSS